MQYSDDEFAEIEQSGVMPGAVGAVGREYRRAPIRNGNGFVFVACVFAWVLPLALGIPTIAFALWRVIRHRYHAWWGVAGALTTVAVGVSLGLAGAMPLR